MAEPDGGAQKTLATAEPTNEERTQQSDGYTDEELDARIEAGATRANARFWAATEQLIDTKNNQLAQRVEERHEDLMGESRYTKALLLRILTNSTTAEDANAIQQALDQEQQQEKVSAAEKKRAAQAETEAERLRKAQVTPEQLERWNYEQSIERVKYLVADRGLSLDPIADLRSDTGVLPKDAPRRADGSINYPVWEREVAKVLDSQVDKREKTESPEMPSGRGGGSSGGDKELLKKAADPNQALSQQEFVRIRQLHEKGIYAPSQL